MDWTKAGYGIAVGVIAIVVAWVALEVAPTVVTDLNAAIAQAQIVLGFFGIVIGATTIGGSALRGSDALTTQEVQGAAALGLIGVGLLLVGWLIVPAAPAG